MQYRGLEIRLLQTIPRGWRWEFAWADSVKDGTGIDRDNAIFRAKKAIDAAFKAAGAPLQTLASSDRSTWLVGQRVARKNADERGTVIEVNGKIKVKWDGGRTSYFVNGGDANVEWSE